MNRPQADWLASSRQVAAGWIRLDAATERASCGGKAASLSRMRASGLPVPDGGVLGIDALERFIDLAGLHMHIEMRVARSREATPDELASIEREVRESFLAVPWPEAMSPLLDAVVTDLAGAGPLAVRSSAVGEDAARASCAGLMDSVLGVSSRAELERAIRRVWASRWSARALAYERASHGQLGGMAVVIQQQIDPGIAGVIFTRSPESGCDDEMLCEYTTGLADRLVAGEVDPARLWMSRSELALIRVHTVDGVPVPKSAAIRGLAQIALAVERLFGAPQDIEFAVDRRQRIWLVQSRPITTLPAEQRRRIVWSNANVNENFPDPITPLLYSIVAPGYSAYFANLGRAFGLAGARLERMQGDLAAIVGVHGGRLYYNLTAIHAVLGEAPFGERLCAWFDEFTGASDPHAASHPRRRGFVRDVHDALELCWIALRTTWQYVFIERRLQRFEHRVDRYAADSAPDRLKSLGMLELRDLLRGFLHIRLLRWTDASLADAAAMVCYGLLKSLVARIARQDEATAAHNDLLKGLSGLKSAAPVEALCGLALRVREDPELQRLCVLHEGDDLLVRLRSDGRFGDFLAAFDDYLERWGFRCSGELMLTVPSFQERPGELLDLVRSQALQGDASSGERLESQRAAREATTRRLLDRARRHRLFPRLHWPTLAPVLRRVLGATQASIGLRERARLQQALLYSRLRRVVLEIGSRLAARGTIAAPGDAFFLSVGELDELLSGRAMFPGAARSTIAVRRTEHERYTRMRPADVLVAPEGDYPDLRNEADGETSATDGLRGASVCGGVTTGTAKVLVDVAQTKSIARGDVLVTRQTDPGWAPAFATIGGLVLERGGMLSHGAILAREYGIPTVVGVARATERIASGSQIRVDGDQGEVHRVGG